MKDQQGHNRAHVSGQWEYHLVNDRLFITSEVDPNVQVQLEPTEAFDLLEYLQTFRAELLAAVLRGQLEQ